MSKFGIGFLPTLGQLHLLRLNYSIKVVRVKTIQLLIEFCTKICYLLYVANLFKQVLVVTPSIRDKVVTKTVFIYIDCSYTILYHKKKKITQRLSIVSYLLFLVPSNVTISQSYYSIKLSFCNLYIRIHKNTFSYVIAYIDKISFD